MVKLDEEAEKRAEERDRRWQSGEEKRDKERMQHEERQAQQMMMMFSSFMGQINNLLMSQYPMPSLFVYAPADYTIHSSPSPSCSSVSNRYEHDSNPTTSTANN